MRLDIPHPRELWHRVRRRPAPTVFLKQYGERRTGTNYLRAVLQLNYQNAVPLMHVLGDKHSPPVDLPDLWDSLGHQPDKDVAFITQATYAAPAESTFPGDPVQTAHLIALAKPLAVAVQTNRLGFLISLKHPLRWAWSYAIYMGWCRCVEGAWEVDPARSAEMEAACRNFNHRHYAWWNFYLDHPGKVCLVHHEVLCYEPYRLLRKIERQFGLVRLRWHWVLPTERVQPTYWDQDQPNYAVQHFEESCRGQDTLHKILGQDIRRMVEEVVDWELMRRFGYDRDCPFAVAHSPCA